MARLLFALVVCLYSTIGYSYTLQQNTAGSPHQMRHQLMLALNNEKITDSLYQQLNNEQSKSALEMGYFGTVQALKAVHAWNPIAKLKYLNAAEKTYSNAVSADPHNIEIRFMRFSVEHHVPSFLGFNKNLAADRKTIIAQLKKTNYSSTDKPFIKTVAQFLLSSNRCTADENAYLNKQLQHLL